MLSNVQVNYLAEKINEKVNLPILGEQAEFALIKKAIYKILDVLEDEVPEEFVDFLEDTAQGFDPGQAVDIELVKNNLVAFVNAKVNLPLVGEETEKKIFSTLADVLFEAMTQGKKLGD